MKYGDPVHKVLRLLESENINPGNLLIGQTVDVKVIDARKAEFLRPMVVGEFYPDGSVLLKDELTQETIVLQFQWNTNTNGLFYTGESDFGVKYELEINRDLMSNESITKLTESRKLNESDEDDTASILNSSKASKYWSKVRPRLTGEFYSKAPIFKQWRHGISKIHPYFLDKDYCITIGVLKNGKIGVSDYGEEEMISTFDGSEQGLENAFNFGDRILKKYDDREKLIKDYKLSPAPYYEF